MTVEQRLDRLEARQNLEDLIGRYALACDDRDLDALADCYTDDGIFDSVGGPVRGRAALLRTYRDRLGPHPTVHLAHRLVLDELHTDHASGRVVARSEIVRPDGLFVIAHRYSDTYRREPDGWRFARRLSRMYYACPAGELHTLTPDGSRARWPGRPAGAADLPESLPGWVEFLDHERQPE
ncbi:nuclear transport factor 2 family protein [Prauserella cavernicola]|uniref:Nuclear transport factor 2 family protein n=1 Tax=Prauserella cavernicola TaxID=2800127 RepID=A0A934QW93_9PSEU|nr:nuclear transport factor 2 family protein [Prauserella cavernicola]MBK1787322.1 nuclear transport factor 2 family protein [Prauserella cavernicola]